MSSRHFPGASTSMYLDPSRFVGVLPRAFFHKYPSLYPIVGASHPPIASPANATLPAFSPLVRGAYGAGGVYNVPNFQGHNTIYSPTGFIPPLENPAPPMNNTNVPGTHYPFHDMLVRNVTSTNAPVPLSVDNGHHEQPAPFTFQSSVPTQSEAPLDQGQAAEGDLAVAEPRRELGDVHGEYYQTNEESHSGLVAPGDPTEENTTIHSCFDNPNSECSGHGDYCIDTLSALVEEYPHVLSNNQSHPTEENTTIHSCFGNLNSECSGHGDYCIDTLSTLVEGYPHVLSPEQIADFFVDTITPPGPDAGQSPVDSPASTSAPSGSSSHSSSNSATHPPAAKRKRSENDLEVCAKKQRQEECTDAQGDCKVKRRKKKKPCDEGEFYCRICMILGKSCRPLSRKDALKRHISTVHELFMALFGHEEFDILKPRRNENEDLVPLIKSCIILQSQARQRGVEVRPTYDLALLHPDIAATMTLS
ncbi:hypothetical protein J3R82DRAFT_6854 [Butyriboletus roseoflavus]|nr:hypothetical protein J3R82DRAFT_6854 [Butyriboletus roseoflavus]